MLAAANVLSVWGKCPSYSTHSNMQVDDGAINSSKSTEIFALYKLASKQNSFCANKKRALEDLLRNNHFQYVVHLTIVGSTRNIWVTPQIITSLVLHHRLKSTFSRPTNEKPQSLLRSTFANRIRSPIRARVRITCSRESKVVASTYWRSLCLWSRTVCHEMNVTWAVEVATGVFPGRQFFFGTRPLLTLSLNRCIGQMLVPGFPVTRYRLLLLLSSSSSPLCRVFIRIFLRQTMSQRNSVQAILLVLFMVYKSVAPVLNLLYFYISTFRSMCVVPNVIVFCSSLTSWFPGMLLMYFLSD
jgi:hypothetical protein